MAGYASVLLPTDGSEGSLVAVEAGLTIADRFGADAHALCVVAGRQVLDEFDHAVEAAEADAVRALDAAAAAGDERRIDVERHLRRGVPHREILAAVEADGADRVVVGIRGRSGLGRLVQLGRTADRVVRTSAVQVLCEPLGDRRAR